MQDPRKECPSQAVPNRGDSPLPATARKSDRPHSQPRLPRWRNTGQITALLQFGHIGRRHFMQFARLAVTIDPKIAPLIEDWDRMKPALRNVANFDALCEAHDLDPYHFVAAVGEAELRACNEASIFIASLNLPFLVDRSIELAYTRNGFRDRQTLLQHAGVIPVPGKKQLGMINHTAVKAEANKGCGKPLPSFEATIAKIEESLKEDE